MYQATAIRNALVTALTGLATTGANVTVDPVYDIESATLPMLVVVTGDESDDLMANVGGRVYHRLLSFSIQGIASATSGLQDIMDQIAAEVEAAIHADATLSATALDTTMVAIRREFKKASRPTGRITIDFDITYTTTL